QAWPATCTAVSCNAGLVNNDGARGWDGPYVEKWPSKSPWGAGVVYYRNDANVNWDNSGVGDSARYFEIQIVPQASAQKIDDNIDGAVAGGSGAVRYSAAATTSVYILIQTDVALN
ncbi:MAG: hypothetical protein KKE64_07380, partial [Candidatus Omnitrophica bacterium]|nr:hypothetical protein [Candidatus Omnitrophota bacterium]